LMALAGIEKEHFIRSAPDMATVAFRKIRLLRRLAT
jgi:hypothetical protein